MSEPKVVPLIDWGCLTCGAAGQIERPQDLVDVPSKVDAAHAQASPQCKSRYRGPNIWVADPRTRVTNTNNAVIW